MSVTARHSQYQVEDITVEVHVDGRLTVTDGAAHVRPGSGFGGQTPTTSAGLSADAELWALAEQVAFRPPPDPPGPPPPGSPGESLVLRRADGSEWAITCTPGAVVHSPEQAAADELLARVVGQGREAVGRDAVRWRGPGPEPIRRPETADARPPWLPPSTDPTATPDGSAGPRARSDEPDPSADDDVFVRQWRGQVEAWHRSSGTLVTVRASLVQQHRSESVTVEAGGGLTAHTTEHGEITTNPLAPDPSIWRTALLVAAHPPSNPAPPVPDLPGRPSVSLSLQRDDGTTLTIEPAMSGAVVDDDQRRADALWRDMLDVLRRATATTGPKRPLASPPHPPPPPPPPPPPYPPPPPPPPPPG